MLYNSDKYRYTGNICSKKAILKEVIRCLQLIRTITKNE